MDELLDRSAMALARMIRRREVSPVELLEAHIAQIDFGGWRRARPSWRVPERFVGPDSLIS